MENFYAKRFKEFIRTSLQRLFITMEFFGKNSLANHSAAGAYGFLLSVTPMMLLLSFFLLHTFESSPEIAASLVNNIPFLSLIAKDEQQIFELLNFSLSGLSGIISIISIFWAGRFLTVSLQSGLKIIFIGEKKLNPITDKLITIAIEFFVLVFSLILILSSRASLYLFETLGYISTSSFLYYFTSQTGRLIFTIIMFGLISFCAYRFIPENAPSRFSALRGSVFCIFFWICLSLGLEIMLKQSKYDFLYGALSDLIMMLITVYFFFMFLFMGGQFAYVLDSFDALLFTRMREARIKIAENKNSGIIKSITNIINGLFSSVNGKLKKYYRFYHKGEILFSRGEQGDAIFYLLEGKVEVILSDDHTSAGIINEDSFFGEMSHLLGEARNATIMANTDVSVLMLPPQLFDKIVKNDTSLDRDIIMHLSRRIQKGNEQITELAAKQPSM
ncbi:MAG: YihY/virulence factor BrkB family protein [Treponema sp.]|nr:YihY/virulence factor BrkB family protein [Treponema sp.]